MVTASELRLAGILILAFILSSVLLIPTHAVDYQAVTATISEAEQALAVGFEAALDAEKAGADISSLLVKLNEGAELLSAAQTALENGDPEEAVRLSGLSIEVGAQVASEALVLKVEAENAASNKYRLYLASSAVAMAIVVLTTLLGYRLLKKRDLEHTLKMRPEVGTG